MLSERYMNVTGECSWNIIECYKNVQINVQRTLKGSSPRTFLNVNIKHRNNKNQMLQNVHGMFFC